MIKLSKILILQYALKRWPNSSMTNISSISASSSFILFTNPDRIPKQYSTHCQCALNNSKLLGIYSKSQTRTNLSLPKLNHCRYEQRRYLWRALNNIANMPDRHRIEEVGAERACAEWLLRNGAYIRMANADTFLKDYNSIPANFHDNIEEVVADESSLMAVGFAHFAGLKVKKIRFHHCLYLEDSALKELYHLAESLQEIQVRSCGDITEEGLQSLAQLKKLRKIVLHDIPEVQDIKAVEEYLKRELPDCEISFT